MKIVQARMINEVLYCERLMYLERVQREFQHNHFTLDGNAVHERADAPSGDLPPVDDPGDRPYSARSVWLTSDTLGLTAKIDVIEGDADGVIPIEYKRGAIPDVPEKAYLPERAQVAAQVMLLREHGHNVSYGEIYFAKSRRRVRVDVDEALVATVRQAIDRVRALDDEQAPPPLVDNPKCRGCSLVGVCLPDEVNVLRGEAGRIRPLVTERDDLAPLYVQDHSAKVGLSGECLVVRPRDGEEISVGLPRTSQVCLFGGAQMSSQAIRECMSREIQVSFFTTGGWYCGRAVGAESKNAELRVAQHRFADDDEACLAVARSIVASKVKNCRTLLRRNAKADVDGALSRLRRLAKQATEARSAEELLGVEGLAARDYFGAFSTMIKSDLSFSLEGRNRRPPRDPVNALLSLAYALLVKDATLACSAAGLDPAIGVYHRPRHGRPALALDLMEEFRAIVADSAVVTAVNTQVVGVDDFTKVGDAVALTPAARRRFIGVCERSISRLAAHPVFGYEVSYRRALEIQARLVGRVFTGEVDSYPEFSGAAE